MDGQLALDLWDVVIEVLYSSQDIQQAPKNRVRNEIQGINPNTILKRHDNREVDELSNVDHVDKRKTFSFRSSFVQF